MYTLRDYMKTPEDSGKTVRKVAEIRHKARSDIPSPVISASRRSRRYLRTTACPPTRSSARTTHVVERIEDAKRDAEILGVDVLRTDSIPESMRNDADGYRRYAEIMNAEGRACKAAGLRYIYHFHAFEWITFGDERGIDILRNETDPDAVMFQPDVFWLTNAGTEPSTSLKLFDGTRVLDACQGTTR